MMSMPGSTREAVLDEHDALLADFRRTFECCVLPTVRRRLGAEARIFRRWLYEPLLYTMSRRRNFFRTGLLQEAARVSAQPGAFVELAASVEIAWTCALVLDDFYDSSDEREGQSTAYLRF